MKKKHLIIVLTLLFMVISLLVAANGSTTVVPLPDVMKPGKIYVDEKQFYIVEGATVRIFQKEGFRFLKKFGKPGMGPQEYNVGQNGVFLIILKDKIIISSFGKLTFVKKDGTYISENRMNTHNYPLCLGENYLISGNAPGYIDHEYVSYYLYNSKMEKVRELTRMMFPLYSKKKRWSFFTQFLNPVFYNGQAFFAVGSELEMIGVNESGQTFLTLKHPYKRIKVTEKDIQAIHAYFKNEHYNRAEYGRIKNQFDFPSYFPAIKDFRVADEQIFIQTYELNQKKESKFLVFSTQGKYIRSFFLQIAIINIEEDFPWVISEGKLYQLIEDYDAEEWNLHVTPLE